MIITIMKAIGLFQKKNQTGGVEDILEPPLRIFHFFTLPLEILDKTKLHPLEIQQICVRSHGNSKTKNQDPWKFHIIFSWSPLEIPFCVLLAPGNSTCYFFDTPGNPISLTLPVFFSGIAH